MLKVAILAVLAASIVVAVVLAVRRRRKPVDVAPRVIPAGTVVTRDGQPVGIVVCDAYDDRFFVGECGPIGAYPSDQRVVDWSKVNK